MRSTRSVLTAIDHPATRRAVEVERAFLAELGSGCSLPVGAHVTTAALHVFLADLDLRPVDHRASVALRRRRRRSRHREARRDRGPGGAAVTSAARSDAGYC